VTDPLASDVAVTWLGAAGCALYARFFWQQHASDFAARATLFLLALLVWVMFLRGFYWLWDSAALGHLVFAGATLLPFALTLFSEGLLRRHHPQWLKLAAVGVSLVFGVANLFFDLASSPPLLIAFCAAFAAIAMANAWLLLRLDGADLSRNEVQLCRAVVIAAVVAVPLIVTDFRETLGNLPVRAGAIGALLFVYTHLGLADRRGVLAPLLGRLAAALAAALLLSATFALAMVGARSELVQAAAYGFPVAFAWVLLTAVALQLRATTLEGRDAKFLRWLSRARLDSTAGFLHSLHWLPQTEDHLVLESEALQGYAVPAIFAVAGRDPVSLGEARAWTRAAARGKAEAGEQLRDLLERHGMTHALLVSAAPPLIVLLNLPSGAQAAVGELRAAVLQHLARRLARK